MSEWFPRTSFEEMGPVENMRPLKAEFIRTSCQDHVLCTQFPPLYLMDGVGAYSITRLSLN